MIKKKISGKEKEGERRGAIEHCEVLLNSMKKNSMLIQINMLFMFLSLVRGSG